MPIAVKHTIKLTENIKINRNPEIYRNPIADPPAFHVGCTCQWEGWAHSRQQADFFVASHRYAQLIRGNTVEVILPESTAVSTPAPDEALCDAPAGSSELAAQLSIARFEGKKPVFPSDEQPIEADVPTVAISETPTSALEGLKSEPVVETVAGGE